MSPMGGSASDTTVVEMSPLETARRQKSTASSSEEEDSVDGKQTEEPLKEIASQNYYELRKNAVHAVMNVPLMTANISQIRSLISSEREENNFFSCVLGLVITSLILQCLFFFACIAIHVRERLVERREKKRALKSSPVLQDEADVDWCLDILNYISLFIVFAITIINMMILGFINVPEQNSNPPPAS